MRVVEHADASAFLEAAAPVLAADEARHNLMYGICSTIVAAPDAYREAYLWTVDDGGDVVAAALMTPPFNIVLARPTHDDALPFLARMLRDRDVALPGVTAALPEGDVFADAWGGQRRLRMSQGVYAARAVRVPDGVSGATRPAEGRDRDVLVDWMHAFHDEALTDDAPQLELDRLVDRRLNSSGGGFVVWEDNGELVSLCGFGGRTPHGIRIGPVYTPPELRGRGYGSAVTAQVTKQKLDAGLDYCFLYTDLANPTSNKIYMDIGYERVCDSAEYVFD
jgi:RimJ/RimL family protein N-acetyltransferase